MLICPICQTPYPEQTTSCPKDGTPLVAEAPEEALSTFDEGITADQLLAEIAAQAPPPPGKLSLPQLKAASADAEAPHEHPRRKTGPVVVVKVSNEDSSELIKAETLAQARPPEVAALALPALAEDNEEDGGLSTLEESPSTLDRYLGTVVTNYKIEKKLGQGGMGAVYLASHFTLGRQVAVKILNQQFVAKHDVVRRFFDEARAANKIKHPNIIEVFDVGILPDRAAYLIMELLEGRDLKSVLKLRGALPAQEVQALFVPICEALQAAHSNGIIHRDLKPENIFICQSEGKDFPKIVDFGIAKLADNTLDVQLRTRTGMVMGTPAYMSPEQAAGQKQLDARADIYSLGVILFECLTGHPPFTGESVAAILIKQVTEIPEQIRNLAPERHIPPKLNELVQRCLEKDPAARPQSMQELLEAMRAPETFISSGTVDAVTRPASEAPEVRPANITKITRVKDLPAEAPAPGKPWLWGVAGVAFAALLFWGVWGFLQPKPANLKGPHASSQEIEIPTLEFIQPSPKGLMRSGRELPLRGVNE